MALALRVYLHSSARLERADCNLERTVVQVYHGRFVLAPVHRQPTEPLQYSPHQQLLKERSLRQRTGRAPRSMKGDEGVDQRIPP